MDIWRVTKETRELRCVVRYLPTGLDLRLMLADEFRTTELHKDAPSAQAQADDWRKSLLERGWLPPEGSRGGDNAADMRLLASP